MKTYLIIGNNINLSTYRFESGSTFVGVDKGAFLALKSRINLDYAVGDFDSASKEQMKAIEACSKKVIRLSSIKDDTDTMHAFNMFKDESNEIVILGGIQGKRVDHLFANMNIVFSSSKVTMEDDDTLIRLLDESHVPYKVTKENYKYFSFFSQEESIITLDGFNYPLTDYSLNHYDSLCISNQLNGECGFISVKKGKVLLIESKNDSNC